MTIVLAKCEHKGVKEQFTEASKQEINSGICSFCGGNTTPASGCGIIRKATKEETEYYKSCERMYGG